MNSCESNLQNGKNKNILNDKKIHVVDDNLSVLLVDFFRSLRFCFNSKYAFYKINF